MKKNMLFISSLLFATVLFANEKKAIYYANGNKHFEYVTTNELLNGELIAWYENGHLKIKGQFKNNQKNGVWTVWDANGIMRAQRKYEDDYSFQIIKEWDSTGRLIDPAIIEQKNERLIAARSKEMKEKQMRYLQRHWKSITADKAANDFLFKDNLFFNYLITQASKKTMTVYNDDRCVNRNEDIQSIKAYKDVAAVEYIIKEDLTYTRDHQVMHVNVLTICPVVLINGERKKVGWFYVPHVCINKQATDEIDEIVTKIENHHFASTVIKSTVHATNKEGDAVTPEESDAINLSTLDYEANAWIAAVAGMR
ncbi:MAG TPA: hypothetical protein VF008_08865 [Niastella sp.]